MATGHSMVEFHKSVETSMTACLDFDRKAANLRSSGGWRSGETCTNNYLSSVA